jgi:hypothetical protein
MDQRKASLSTAGFPTTKKTNDRALTVIFPPGAITGVQVSTLQGAAVTDGAFNQHRFIPPETLSP